MSKNLQMKICLSLHMLKANEPLLERNIYNNLKWSENV